MVLELRAASRTVSCTYSMYAHCLNGTSSGDTETRNALFILAACIAMTTSFRSLRGLPLVFCFSGLALRIGYDMTET